MHTVKLVDAPAADADLVRVGIDGDVDIMHGVKVDVDQIFIARAVRQLMCARLARREIEQTPATTSRSPNGVLRVPCPLIM